MSWNIFENEQKEILEQLIPLNEDELFYKQYYKASKNPAALEKFLRSVKKEDIIRRHLVVPEILPEIISYQMNDDEYFNDQDAKNVYILPHNRYTPAFMHRHDFFEIIYVYEGSCSQSIGMKRYNFVEGDIIFISPGIYHTMEVFNDESIVFNILLRKKTFHRMFLPLATGNNIQSQFFKEGLFESHRLEYLLFHTGKEEKDFILKMYQEHLKNDNFSDQILIGMLTFMNANIMRDFKYNMDSSYTQNKIHQSNDFIVLNYIQEHISTMTLSDVAEHFGFSISYCSKLIKNTTGMGFNDWKRILRMRRAEHMLINTNSTVNDISISLGYENTETFIRAFKKEMHMTPSSYRKNVNLVI